MPGGSEGMINARMNLVSPARALTARERPFCSAVGRRAGVGVSEGLRVTEPHRGMQ